MSNSGIKIWLSSIVAVALIIVVSACCFLLPKNEDIPTLTLEYSGTTESGGVESPTKLAPIGGTISSSESGGTAYLTAVASVGYVFAYWVNASNEKVAGDASIKVMSTAMSNFTPIFFEVANVVEVTTLDTIRNEITAGTTSGKIYKLMNDISLNSTAFTPMGTFSGVFDGNGKKIYGLSISTASPAGLFTDVNGAVIKNLILSSGTIRATGASAGSFCATITNSLLSRCISYLSITNNNASGIAGGIVAVSNSTTDKSMLYCCGFYGSVSAKKVDSILGQNSTIIAIDVDSCDLFRNFNSGAVYQL